MHVIIERSVLLLTFRQRYLYDRSMIHMPVSQLVEHRRMDRCEKAVAMRIRLRGVEMMERCEEMEFSFYGREGYALVEVVANFKYLG